MARVWPKAGAKTHRDRNRHGVVRNDLRYRNDAGNQLPNKRPARVGQVHRVPARVRVRAAKQPGRVVGQEEPKRGVVKARPAYMSPERISVS